MNQAAEYAIKRLKEHSTWRGLILLATSAGIAISEEMAVQIVAFGLGFAGLVGALFSDTPAADQRQSNRIQQ
jgi:hypothetical protein